jgi:hypothetical protein
MFIYNYIDFLIKWPIAEKISGQMIFRSNEPLSNFFFGQMVFL